MSADVFRVKAPRYGQRPILQWMAFPVEDGAVKNLRLNRASFSGREIAGLRFRHCLFYACTFAGSTFTGCIFESCVFASCRFIRARWKDCAFSDSNLLGGDFWNASIHGSWLNTNAQIGTQQNWDFVGGEGFQGATPIPD